MLKHEVTCIELRKYRGETIALLMKNRRDVPERYIVARCYNALAAEWYGSGNYFTDIKEAVDYYDRITKPDPEERGAE